MRILFVDDDPNILLSYQRSLRRQFVIETANGGAEGLEMLRTVGPYGVILSDMSMPGMSGLEFLAKAKTVAPDSVLMMLTGNADLATAVEALNSGSIFRFLLKPCLPEALAMNIQLGIDQYNLIHAEKELLEKTLQGSIRMLIEILATTNPELFGRAQTLRMQMRTLAESLGLEDIWSLELAALLSQIGVVTLPTTLLRKIQARQALSDAEMVLADRIPEISHSLLVKIPRLEPVAEMIRYGQKLYDGSGVPRDNVAGESIPVGARLLKILVDLAHIQGGNLSPSGAFSIMKRRIGVYDPKFLAAAEMCFSPDQNHINLPEGRAVSHSDLMTGMVLAADVETISGLLLVPAGKEITLQTLEHIRSFANLTGLKEPIYVEANGATASDRLKVANG